MKQTSKQELYDSIVASIIYSHAAIMNKAPQEEILAMLSDLEKKLDDYFKGRSYINGGIARFGGK